MQDDATPAQPEASYTEESAAQAFLGLMKGQAKEATPEESVTETPDAEVADAEPSEQPQGTADDAPADDEADIEIDVAGAKFRLPAALAEQARTIQTKVKELESGATRKFQEASDLRKQVEAERESVAKYREAAQAQIDLMADYRAVTRQIEAIQQSDLSALSEADPIAAQKQLAQLMTLQHTQQRIGAQMQQAMQAMQAEEARRNAELVQKGIERVSKSIPDWSEAKAKELAAYATSRGLSDAAMRAANFDPALIEILHDSMTLKAIREKKPETKRANEAPKTLKPTGSGTSQSAGRERFEKAKQEHRKHGSLESAAGAFLAGLRHAKR